MSLSRKFSYELILNNHVSAYIYASFSFSFSFKSSICFEFQFILQKITFIRSYTENKTRFHFFNCMTHFLYKYVLYVSTNYLVAFWPKKQNLLGSSTWQIPG